MTEPAQPQPKQPEKQIEKVKSDQEKLPEKLKPEAEKLVKEIEKVKSDEEKLPEKIKPEKEVKLEKLELKEHKHEKLEKPEKEKREKEKFEKENKLEIKEIKFEKENKFEIKEAKPENENFPAKGLKENEAIQPPQAAGPPIDRDALLRHAEALESMGRDLRHFIEQSERPDLTQGALHNEPDQRDDTSGDA